MMPIEQERLIALLEFAQQSAKMRSTPAFSLRQHNIFNLHENDLQGLPGISLNLGSGEDEDEVWLSVERLHEQKPPEITSPILIPWISLTQAPNEIPKLSDSIEGAMLIAAGTHRSSQKTYLTTEEEGLPEISPRKIVTLEDYEKKGVVRAQFKLYVDNKWTPWAEVEKEKRKTIRLYAQLFTLKQQLEGGIVEAQLELVCGVGVGIWNCNGTSVNYPVITRLTELALNPATAAIEIRPRDVEPRIEVDWYAAQDNPGVQEFEKGAKEFFSKATQTFSPFDRGTYETLLRSAVTNLDANGIYWPDKAKAEDRSLPKAETNLVVTDTWVLFARPRTNSVYLQDLEKLKSAVREADSVSELPPAVAAMVVEPATTNDDVSLPNFRGLSLGSYDGESASVGMSKARDLYFPKPFNGEQVRIVQLLDICDGVVVQGPPGTGKTHTIANVICHYLAEGKRVLVTSMKDPALAVLKGQLPDEIRPLAITLLTSEQEGLKQFEYAIHAIASEIQGIDRHGMAREIDHLEQSIDRLHGRLASIDRKVGEWAKRNLEKISLDGSLVDPQEAAQEVVGGVGQFEWFPDELGISPDFNPQFKDEDIVRLREARQILGADIDYLGCSVPEVVQLPDSKSLLQVHQDLSRFEVLKKVVEVGGVPPLANSSQEILEVAQALLDHCQELRSLRDSVINSKMAWVVPIRQQLLQGKNADFIAMLESLGEETRQAVESRKEFVAKPVAMQASAENDPEYMEAIQKLATGRSPFGIQGWFGKAAQKKRIEAVRILGNPPVTQDEWRHVVAFSDLQNRLRSIALRWNSIAEELGLDLLPGTNPEHGLLAAQAFAVYLTVKATVAAEKELLLATAKVFPTLPSLQTLIESPQRLAELEAALHHHLAKNRLADVWVLKEKFQKVLQGRDGRIVDAIRDFMAKLLGNPDVNDAQMQGKWSELVSELARVHGLRQHLTCIAEITGKIETSGASQYAKLLRKPNLGATDALLPDNWREVWRLRRLTSHLESIEAHEELKTLSKERSGLEQDLATAYSDIVVKRTWLKLAENASPSIRAALMAYLTAIQKIGKGTGKRAVRYRQDARAAASQANSAVPCWIMPHYRISESLPPELGCFDLVIIDEASQSDLTALPALLRAKKVLIVGDDKQVSPEGVGLEEERVRSLMTRFLKDQVPIYLPLMSPERSIYDLFKVVFAKSSVMLKEHFRCVGPIIEYSKREFYNHELRPLRIPTKSERLDPPLIDVFVEDGFRSGDINHPEISFIVEEIQRIVEDPQTQHCSIGMVSLLGEQQALKTWDRITNELGTEFIQKHQIACGDARAFQGKERDIMFLSMVSAPNERGAALSRDTFAQRFNVAASRAKNRMYLVRSLELADLSEADKLRRSLISHFSTPYAQDEIRVEDMRKLCESPFERDVYDELTQRGYWITPQVKVGQYRIDMVVEGKNDARLALECDGDRYHGPDKWADDMQRQRILERAGWVFWRCFASTYVRRKATVIQELIKSLEERGIEPVGAEGAPQSIHTAKRVYREIGRPEVDVSQNLGQVA